MALREGFEPPTDGIEARCSNPLSYRSVHRGNYSIRKSLITLTLNCSLSSTCLQRSDCPAALCGQSDCRAFMVVVNVRSITPAASQMNNMDNTADDLAVIDSRYSANLIGQQRLKGLGVREPKILIGYD